MCKKDLSLTVLGNGSIYLLVSDSQSSMAPSGILKVTASSGDDNAIIGAVDVRRNISANNLYHGRRQGTHAKAALTKKLSAVAAATPNGLMNPKSLSPTSRIQRPSRCKHFGYEELHEEMSAEHLKAMDSASKLNHNKWCLSSPGAKIACCPAHELAQEQGL